MAGFDWPTVLDAGKSFGAGVGSGLAQLFGIPGDANAALNSQVFEPYVFGPLDRAIGYQAPPAPAAPPVNLMPTSDAIRNYMRQNVITYQPQTTAGQYAQSAGEMIPNAALGLTFAGGLGAAASDATAALPYFSRFAADALGHSTAGALTGAMVAGNPNRMHLFGPRQR